MLLEQVGDVNSLVEQATDKATQARGLQHACSEMFCALEVRARRAVGFICKEDVASPLMGDDAG